MLEITHLATTILTSDSWFAQWLGKYFGSDAANKIQMALTIIINLLVAYIIVMQIFRIMKGVENKNSADSGEKAQATATIKNGIIVIVLTSLIGAVGFNMFLWLGGTFLNS